LKVAFQSALSITLLAALPSQGADLAVLRNGNSIRHERRESTGPLTRLYLSGSNGGYLEIPSDQIERYETDTAPGLPSSGPGAAPFSPNSGAAHLKVQPSSNQSLSELISGAGKRHQIDPDFINSVIRAESGFNSHAVSKKGAQGLMQLMPKTASQLGVGNAFDPRANVEGGTRYLRELLEKYNFDVPKALAAYNAGPQRVDRYQSIPPYSETQTYVSQVIRDFNRRKLAENPALAQKSTEPVHLRKAKTTAAARLPAAPGSVSR
jgi:soluble lytic murein transglycosylase-like protein